MYDQAGMLREMVKWDYEMKRGDQAATVVDRALELAMTSPQGPVYLSSAARGAGRGGDHAGGEQLARIARRRAHRMPSASDIERLADWIAAARDAADHHRPAGPEPARRVALARLAERYALPVIPFNTRYFAISANHPMFQGSAPGPLLREADLVIVIESDVPWMPSKEAPPAGARIVQIGEDPLYARYPMRGFPSDLTITATSLSVLEALEQALHGRTGMPHRRGTTSAAGRALRRAARDTGARRPTRPGAANTITLAWLNHCLREVVDRDTIVISEYSFRQEYCPLDTPGSLFAREFRRRPGLGVPAPRSARSWPRRSSRCCRFLAMAPTCSPIRPPATTSRRCRTCRC